MSKTKKSIVFYILMLGWMAFIFIMSAQSAVQSSEISGGIVSKLISVFIKDFNSLSAEKQLEITNIVTVVVRKSAHFLEYFVLGILSFLSARYNTKHKYITKMLYALIICVLYAASDEIHQYFVPGRACRITDICIDALGSAVAILLVVGIARPKKDKNQVESMNKKKLIEQNFLLFENLQKTQRELADLKQVLSQNMEEINALKSQLEKSKEVQTEPKVTEPIRRLEETMIANAALKPDMEYGAQIIGKIVVCAAEYSNKLTAGGNDTHKELLNLILGKTEIAKAEILSVIESADNFDVKCEKIDKIADAAKEYFDSVLAQII